MKNKLIAVCALLIATSAFAKDVVKTDNTKEIAMDQKLSRVYDLYRKGDAVSLNSKETMVGVGINYSINDKNTLGLRESTRALTTQAFASRGIGHGMEISVSAPYTVQSQNMTSGNEVLGNKTFSGFGDPTVRLMGTLPTKDFTTTLFASTTIPVGDTMFSPYGMHTSFGVNLNKVLRPAFVSGGLSWERDWKSGTNGVGYNAGVGFFLNHSLSVGGGINGILMLNPENGRARDLASFGLKIAYQTTPNFGVVASTNFGLTADTPPVAVGITAYWRF
jgi:opacity protein-like surface antigen